MRYSICVIDDKIPASGVEGIRDSDLLNASNLQMMLRQEELWTDEVIKNLIRTLLDQKDADNVTTKWDVYGFTNPSFFINTLRSLIKEGSSILPIENILDVTRRVFLDLRKYFNTGNVFWDWRKPKLLSIKSCIPRSFL